MSTGKQTMQRISFRRAVERSRRRVSLAAALTACALALAAPGVASDINRTFTFNAADQLTNVKDFNVTTADFAYDASGERIKATWYEGGVQQSQTIYIRDPQGNVLAEYDGNGALIAQYVYLNGKKLCRIAADGTKTYYHDDPLGTAMAVTDDAGQAVWRGEYYPFGTEYSHSGSRNDTYTFTGHEHDAKLSLFYMHARYYDPEIGRFVSTDPVAGRNNDPQSWNRYAYALNNPLRLVDPDGMAPLPPPGGLQRMQRFYRKVYCGLLDVPVAGPVLAAAWETLTGAPVASQEAIASQLALSVMPGGAASPEAAALEGLPGLPRSVGAAAEEIQLASRVKDSAFAVRQAERLSEAAQRDVDNLLAALRRGNINPGIGTRSLGSDFYELRGANAGRVIVKRTGASSFDIVGKFQAHVRGDAANSSTIRRLMGGYGQH